MSVEYDHLLHTFLDLQSTDHKDLETAVQAYFDVKTHIYHEITWLKQHRICAYLTMYIQFFQLILYFSAHPKMALLTATIGKAFQSILHFLLLFGTLFSMFAFSAHWMFGDYIEVFGTYGETVKQQVRMIVTGEIWTDGAENLNDTMTAMYWLYACTLVLVMTWTLLNFFLAIVVDAFADVKEENVKLETVQSFPTDCFDVIWTYYLTVKNKWPARRLLLGYFQDKLECSDLADEGVNSWINKLAFKDEEEAQDSDSKKVTCSWKDVVDNVEGLSDDTLAQILAHYFAKTDKVICRNKLGKSLSKSLSKSKSKFRVVPEDAPQADPQA
jgi:hypothetical protein